MTLGFEDRVGGFEAFPHKFQMSQIPNYLIKNSVRRRMDRASGCGGSVRRGGTWPVSLQGYGAHVASRGWWDGLAHVVLVCLCVDSDRSSLV